jgi:uncharacterized membrane protein
MCAQRSGVITRIDHDALVEIARANDCVLNLLPSLGEFVPAGAPLIESSRELSPADNDAALQAVQIDLERTLDQDLAYGLRMLVDIAERSLSDSPFLDPTTAVQAIDRLYDCLRQLAPRPFPDGTYSDAQGTRRLVTKVMSWEEYVHLAFDEIRIAGSASPQIVRRLRAALEDLLRIAPPERKPCVQVQLDLLESGVREAFSNPIDREHSSQSDRSGIG